MPSSTRWRVYVTAVNGASETAITEVTMASSAGGSDLCTGGTPSASSGTAATNAFDANAGTWWVSSGGGTQWIEYQFAGAVSIVQYSVKHLPSGGGYGPYAPKDFKLQSFDGSGWVDADSQTNQQDWRPGEIRAFPTASKMLWRLNVSDSQTPPFAIMAEVELRTSVAGANQATVSDRCWADSYASADDVTYAAGKAIDGNSATRWASSNASLPHQWRHWFDTPKDVIEYVITAANASGWEVYAPKSWTLEYYDGASWVVADTRTSVANWSSGESRTYSWGPTYTLTADAGSHTFTGNAGGLSAHRRLACAAGSIAFTGNAAALSGPLGLGTGTYSLTGNAGLAAHRKLVCAAGSVAFTGNAALLNRPLSAGHYSFTGMAAAIRAIHRGFTDQQHALESVALVYGFTDQQHALSVYGPTHSYTDNLSVLDAYEQAYGFTDAQQTLDAYETSYGFTDNLAVLDAYALSYGYTDASQALNAYEVWAGTLDQSYVLDAYAPVQYGYTDGLSALDAPLASYGYTDGLSALQTPTELLRGWTDSQYALEVRARAFGYADQAHALDTYSLSYGHLDGQYALNAWQALYGFLDSLHALEARAVAYGYSDFRNALDADAVFYGWVLNAATEAASRYEGFNFNSLCEIDASRYLGASSAGIHELGGETDAGTEIAAFVLSGLEDFKSDYQKRVPDAYIAAESDGKLTLKVTADGVTDTYSLSESGTLKNRKVPLGKGRKGRYWQLEIANQDGAGFTLDKVSLNAEVLSRRV
jgi:hypothetical protein